MSLAGVHMGTSLIRKDTPLGPYNRPMPGSWGGPRGVSVFLRARYPCTGRVCGLNFVFSPFRPDIRARFLPARFPRGGFDLYENCLDGMCPGVACEVGQGPRVVYAYTKCI